MTLLKKALLPAVLVMAAGMAAHSQKPAASASNKDSVRMIEKDTVQIIEVEAKVDAAAWRKHLSKYLMDIMDRAASKGLPPGVYTVNVRFIVEKDGSITDVEALNDIGYGVKEGVEKMIRKAPKWTPGTQNGVAVRSYHTQPVSFSVSK